MIDFQLKAISRCKACFPRAAKVVALLHSPQ